jgi:alpha-beta hydrolase superfamily lysophospholipase
MSDSYRNESTWVQLQRYLPPAYRWEPGFAPTEESFHWRNSDIHVDRFENPASPCKLILHHGVGTNGRLLQLIAGAPLAKLGFEVAAVDMPLYGMTRNGEPGIRWEDWVEIGSEFLEREKSADSRPVFLYGLSAGGMLAYNVACETRKVSGIIGMCFIDARSPLARMRMSDRPRMDEVAFKMLAAMPDGMLRNMRVPMKHLVKMKALVNDDRALRLLMKDKHSAGASVTLEFVDSMIQYPPTIAFEDFDLCPVLLTQPGDDRWTPFSVTEPFWRRLRAPKKIVTLDNSGHYPIEEPGLTQMRDAIAEFVRSPGIHGH